MEIEFYSKINPVSIKVIGHEKQEQLKITQEFTIDWRTLFWVGETSLNDISLSVTRIYGQFEIEGQELVQKINFDTDHLSIKMFEEESHWSIYSEWDKTIVERVQPQSVVIDFEEREIKVLFNNEIQI